MPVSKGELGHDIEIDRAVFPVISTSRIHAARPRCRRIASAWMVPVSDRAQEARLVRHAGGNHVAGE